MQHIKRVLLFIICFTFIISFFIMINTNISYSQSVTDSNLIPLKSAAIADDISGILYNASAMALNPDAEIAYYQKWNEKDDIFLRDRGFFTAFPFLLDSKLGFGMEWAKKLFRFL